MKDTLSKKQKQKILKKMEKKYNKLLNKIPSGATTQLKKEYLLAVAGCYAKKYPKISRVSISKVFGFYFQLISHFEKRSNRIHIMLWNLIEDEELKFCEDFNFEKYMVYKLKTFKPSTFVKKEFYQIICRKLFNKGWININVDKELNKYKKELSNKDKLIYKRKKIDKFEKTIDSLKPKIKKTRKVKIITYGKYTYSKLIKKLAKKYN